MYSGSRQDDSRQCRVSRLKCGWRDRCCPNWGNEVKWPEVFHQWSPSPDRRNDRPLERCHACPPQWSARCGLQLPRAAGHGVRRACFCFACCIVFTFNTASFHLHTSPTSESKSLRAFLSDIDIGHGTRLLLIQHLYSRTLLRRRAFPTLCVANVSAVILSHTQTLPPIMVLRNIAITLAVVASRAQADSGQQPLNGFNAAACPNYKDYSQHIQSVLLLVHPLPSPADRPPAATLSPTDLCDYHTSAPTLYAEPSTRTRSSVSSPR
jgi:hypothetical protein